MRFVIAADRRLKRFASTCVRAVNEMLKSHLPLRPGQQIEIDGIKVRTFDTRVYNYYYFNWQRIYRNADLTAAETATRWEDARILHFKSDVRLEYYRLYHPRKFPLIRLLHPLVRNFNRLRYSLFKRE